MKRCHVPYGTACGSALLLLALLCAPATTTTSAAAASYRSAELVGQRKRGVTAPLLAEEIDLDTMDGLDQLTRLVLHKTDSVPRETDRLDARYLNSLMETLYTGLRKPFKSVSADILGIFPTLEFLNISCELPPDGAASSVADKLAPASIRRRSASGELWPPPEQLSDNASYSLALPDAADRKSSIQVCRAVTGDCLSMNELIKILPPSTTAANSILTRLCPVILFRLMSNICRRDAELISAYREGGAATEEETAEASSRITAKEALNLNTLQILKSLHNSDEASSKRPQKLHKKLKTRTNYQNSVRVNTAGLKQQRVDEQLLKIKLKLSEPSIEKVWIFSLLFVILSIVVSMGGLIVLPFVKKTTRRRILTLFEGLAVGGLTGSATLHMFPQAFGLVDENYHRYFWRIFVVFLGIYLCYLCERTIKILKVVRAKMRRRSRASLTDMDFRYGFPTFGRELDRGPFCALSDYRIAAPEHRGIEAAAADRKVSRRMWGKRRPEMDGEFFELDAPSKPSEGKKRRKESEELDAAADEPSRSSSKRSRAKKKKKSRNKDSKVAAKDARLVKRETGNPNNGSDCEPLELDQSMAPTRQRLVRCLKSVRSQFSPVYVVSNQPTAEAGMRTGKSRLPAYEYGLPECHHKAIRSTHSTRKNRLYEDSYAAPKIRGGGKQSLKRQAKQEEMETMLYHRNLMEQQNRDGPNLGGRFQQQQQQHQHRASDVNDLTEGRQDQNNPARMSVDTVSWMILFGDGLLNVIDGLSIGAAFERNILAGISISVAVMLEEVTHRLGTTAILIRTGFSIKQSFICTFLSACALFPGMIIGIVLSDATDEATPYIFCAAGGIFLYTGLVDVMKEMNRSIENAMRKDIRTTLKIFALQNIGIIVAVVFLSFLALYEPDFEEYQKILNSN